MSLPLEVNKIPLFVMTQGGYYMDPRLLPLAGNPVGYRTKEEIPVEERAENMIVLADNTIYQLRGGTENEHYVDILSLLIPLSQKGSANGVATLGGDGVIPSSQLPTVAISNKTEVVPSEAAMLNLGVSHSFVQGDVAIRTDTNQTFRLTTADATVLGNWQEILTPASVVSVNGNTGVVVLTLDDLAETASRLHVSPAEKATWNSKQDALTFDNRPTKNSNNPVKSGGVYEEIYQYVSTFQVKTWNGTEIDVDNRLNLAGGDLDITKVLFLSKNGQVIANGEITVDPAGRYIEFISAQEEDEATDVYELVYINQDATLVDNVNVNTVTPIENIAENSNLNLIQKSGFYASPATVTNNPTADPYLIQVLENNGKMFFIAMKEGSQLDTYFGSGLYNGAINWSKGAGVLADKDYPDIAQRDLYTADLEIGEHVFVEDASADGVTGWAIYRWNGSSFAKIMDQDDLDVDLSVYLNKNTGGTINGPVKIQSDGTSLFKLLELGLDGGRDWYLEQLGTGPGTHLRIRSKENKDWYIDLNTLIIRKHDGSGEIARISPANGKFSITGILELDPSTNTGPILIKEGSDFGLNHWTTLDLQGNIFAVADGPKLIINFDDGQNQFRQDFTFLDGRKLSFGNDLDYQLEYTDSTNKFTLIHDGKELLKWGADDILTIGAQQRQVPNPTPITHNAQGNLSIDISSHGKHKVTLSADVDNLILSGGLENMKAVIEMAVTGTPTIIISPDWATSEVLSVGDVRKFPNNRYYKVPTGQAHTAGADPYADLALGKWVPYIQIQNDPEGLFPSTDDTDWYHIETIANDQYLIIPVYGS